MRRRLAVSSVALLAFAFASGEAVADATNVAVAANFTQAANEIAAAFAAAGEHEAVLSFGSTGQLYTQITQGAPFEVFLAADAERPARAVAEGLAVADSLFTYAVGQLVLYSADPDLVTGPETLEAGAFRQIAIADPAAAPYGAAALETIEALGLTEALTPRMVQGTSIAQAYQFVETGNAELGFVALGQVVNASGGSRWEVPQDLYQPILQDAVLLETGEGRPAAEAFVDFLQGPEALEIIRRYGYRIAE